MTLEALLAYLDEIVRDSAKVSDELMRHAPPTSTAMQRAMMFAHDAQSAAATVRERLQMEGLRLLEDVDRQVHGTGAAALSSRYPSTIDPTLR